MIGIIAFVVKIVGLESDHMVSNPSSTVNLGMPHFHYLKNRDYSIYFINCFGI